GAAKLVWDVYYPGFQNFDEALKSNWKKTTPEGTVSKGKKPTAYDELTTWVGRAHGNINDVNQRFEEEGFNKPAGNFNGLTEEVREELIKAGLTKDTEHKATAV